MQQPRTAKEAYRVHASIAQDPLYQFMNEFHTALNEVIAAYRSGVRTGGEFAKDLIEWGKKVAEYVKDFTKEQRVKYTAIKDLLNETNPIQKGVGAKNIDKDKVVQLEKTVLDLIREQERAITTAAKAGRSSDQQKNEQVAER